MTRKHLFEIVLLLILLIYPTFYGITLFFPIQGIVLGFINIHLILVWLLPVSPVIAIFAIGAINTFKHKLFIIVLSLLNILFPLYFFYWASHQ